MDSDEYLSNVSYLEKDAMFTTGLIIDLAGWKRTPTGSSVNQKLHMTHRGMR